jgi:hypothetical protein
MFQIFWTEKAGVLVIAPPEDITPAPSLDKRVLPPLSKIVLTFNMLIYAPINLYPIKN